MHVAVGTAITRALRRDVDTLASGHDAMMMLEPTYREGFIAPGSATCPYVEGTMKAALWWIGAFASCALATRQQTLPWED